MYAFDAVTGAFLCSYATPSRSGISSSPTVANGLVFFGSDKLYVLSATTCALQWTYSSSDSNARATTLTVAYGVVYFGLGRTIYAYNIIIDKLLWSYTNVANLSAFFSSPTVSNGVVYAGSADNNLYALNATTGALIWFYKTNGPITSTPAVANGMVYIGSYDHNIYAINAKTNVLVWTYTTGNDIVSSPAVANGKVYVGSQDDKLYALNAKTG